MTVAVTPLARNSQCSRTPSRGEPSWVRESDIAASFSRIIRTNTEASPRVSAATCLTGEKSLRYKKWSIQWQPLEMMLDPLFGQRYQCRGGSGTSYATAKHETGSPDRTRKSPTMYLLNGL